MARQKGRRERRVAFVDGKPIKRSQIRAIRAAGKVLHFSNHERPARSGAAPASPEGVAPK
jgi:hypothetical protein